MRMAIDTNRYRDFCEGQHDVVEQFAHAAEIHLPFVTLAELRAGFRCGSIARKNEAVLQRFLNNSRVHLLFPSEQTTHHYAGLYTQLRTQGTPIPTNDLWIASLVIEHDLLLCTRDRHFNSLPQLPLLP